MGPATFAAIAAVHAKTQNLGPAVGPLFPDATARVTLVSGHGSQTGVIIPCLRPGDAASLRLSELHSIESDFGAAGELSSIETTQLSSHTLRSVLELGGHVPHLVIWDARALSQHIITEFGSIEALCHEFPRAMLIGADTLTYMFALKDSFKVEPSGTFRAECLGDTLTQAVAYSLPLDRGLIPRLQEYWQTVEYGYLRQHWRTMRIRHLTNKLQLVVATGEEFSWEPFEGMAKDRIERPFDPLFAVQDLGCSVTELLAWLNCPLPVEEAATPEAVQWQEQVRHRWPDLPWFMVTRAASYVASHGNRPLPPQPD